MRRWKRTLRLRPWPRNPAGPACACAKSQVLSGTVSAQSRSCLEGLRRGLEPFKQA